MDDSIKQTTEDFYEGLSGEDAWDRALCNFTDRLGFTTSSIHLFRSDGIPLRSMYNSKFPEDGEQIDYETLSFNPRYDFAKFIGDQSGRTLTDIDVISKEKAETNVWYQDIGKPMECYSWLGGFVPIHSDIHPVFCAMRGTNWIDPSIDERLLMHKTLNALAGVFDTFTKIEKYNVKNALNLLESTNCLCAIRRDGKVVDYNCGFKAETKINSSILLRHGFLTFLNSEDQNKLDQLLQSPLIAKKSFVTSRLNDGSHRRIKLLPFPWSRVGPSSVVGLLSIEAAKPALTLDRELLKLNYELTASEADVAELLTQGKSTEELAEERGVLVSTVRTQINALMDKMHCKSRVQLMSVLMRYLSF